jgi:tRNA-modifying protein YgfZ
MGAMESEERLYADRSGRGKLRLTGPQRAWFLHQILTQAFEDARPGDARDAAMITAHGRMAGYMETVATEDAFLVHFEPSLRETLPGEIRRYVFATQVEIEDVTEAMGLVLVVGTGWDGAAHEAAPAGVAHPTRSLGRDAGYVWVDGADVGAVTARLEQAGYRGASEDELELTRIAAGVPRWGAEMGTKTFPQEAGIDGWAVHYDKGCYLGQEAMAKIHFRGKVNRRLARLTSSDSVHVGADLTVDGKKIGSVTSAADHRGLALVRYDVAPGTSATADDVVVTIE